MTFLRFCGVLAFLKGSEAAFSSDGSAGLDVVEGTKLHHAAESANLHDERIKDNNSLSLCGTAKDTSSKWELVMPWRKLNRLYAEMEQVSNRVDQKNQEIRTLEHRVVSLRTQKELEEKTLECQAKRKIEQLDDASKKEIEALKEHYKRQDEQLKASLRHAKDEMQRNLEADKREMEKKLKEETQEKRQRFQKIFEDDMADVRKHQIEKKQKLEQECREVSDRLDQEREKLGNCQNNLESSERELQRLSSLADRKNERIESLKQEATQVADQVAEAREAEKLALQAASESRIRVEKDLRPVMEQWHKASIEHELKRAQLAEASAYHEKIMARVENMHTSKDGGDKGQHGQGMAALFEVVAKTERAEAELERLNKDLAEKTKELEDKKKVVDETKRYHEEFLVENAAYGWTGKAEGLMRANQLLEEKNAAISIADSQLKEVEAALRQTKDKKIQLETDLAEKQKEIDGQVEAFEKKMAALDETREAERIRVATALKSSEEATQKHEEFQQCAENMEETLKEKLEDFEAEAESLREELKKKSGLVVEYQEQASLLAETNRDLRLKCATATSKLACMEKAAEARKQCAIAKKETKVATKVLKKELNRSRMSKKKAGSSGSSPSGAGAAKVIKRGNAHRSVVQSGEADQQQLALGPISQSASSTPSFNKMLKMKANQWRMLQDRKLEAKNELRRMIHAASEKRVQEAKHAAAVDKECSEDRIAALLAQGRSKDDLIRNLKCQIDSLQKWQTPEAKRQLLEAVTASIGGEDAQGNGLQDGQGQNKRYKKSSSLKNMFSVAAREGDAGLPGASGLSSSSSSGIAFSDDPCEKEIHRVFQIRANQEQMEDLLRNEPHKLLYNVPDDFAVRYYQGKKADANLTEQKKRVTQMKKENVEKCWGAASKQERVEFTTRYKMDIAKPLVDQAYRAILRAADQALELHRLQKVNPTFNSRNYEKLLGLDEQPQDAPRDNQAWKTTILKDPGQMDVTEKQQWLSLVNRRRKQKNILLHTDKNENGGFILKPAVLGEGVQADGEDLDSVDALTKAMEEQLKAINHAADQLKLPAVLRELPAYTNPVKSGHGLRCAQRFWTEYTLRDGQKLSGYKIRALYFYDAASGAAEQKEAMNRGNPESNDPTRYTLRGIRYDQMLYLDQQNERLHVLGSSSLTSITSKPQYRSEEVVYYQEQMEAHTDPQTGNTNDPETTEPAKYIYIRISVVPGGGGAAAGRGSVLAIQG
ncbi:unnamed protein product [Amoebophrya sp. A25]|nr:unnamed protein product [Amoebophrya sp. A25]|eukprot:GSA25T00026234001.1